MDNDRPAKAAKMDSASPRSVIKDTPLIAAWPGRDLRVWSQTRLCPKRDTSVLASEEVGASFPGRPLKVFKQSCLPFVPSDTVSCTN